MTLDIPFWAWFDNQRGAISVREVERRGGVPHGRISNAYKRKEPSAMVCDAIADGLELDQAEVYRQAGVLKPKESSNKPPLILVSIIFPTTKYEPLIFRGWKNNPYSLPPTPAPPPIRAKFALPRGVQ